MRLRSTVAAVVAAVPLALAGCSQGGPAEQAAPQPAPQQPAPQGQPQQVQPQQGQPPQQPPQGQQGQQPPQGQPPQGQAPQPAPPPASPQAVAWTGQLCTSIGGFAASQQQSPQVDRSTPETFKSSSVQQLTAAEQAADTSVQGLEHIGPGPVPGADHLAQNFAGSFHQIRDVLDAAKSKAQGVDTSNQQAFTAGMTGVQQELKKGQSLNFDSQFSEFDQNAGLRNAAGYAPACQALMKAPQQQGQQQGQQPPG